MNLMSIPSMAEYLSAKASEADSLVEIDNHEMLVNFVEGMVGELHTIGRVLREMFTLVEYRDFFGDSAYDHITVKRLSETYYEAYYSKEWPEEFSKHFGLPKKTEFEASGTSADEARSNVIIQIMFMLEEMKVKSWESYREEDRPRFARGFGIKPRPTCQSEVHNDEDMRSDAKANKSSSDIDEGFANAPGPGSCEPDHDDD